MCGYKNSRFVNTLVALMTQYLTVGRPPLLLPRYFERDHHRIFDAT